jgi:hypothetical protein
VRVVSEITRRFELRLAEGSEAAPVLGITLLPREGSLWMGFRRRNTAGLARPRVHGNGRPSCCKLKTSPSWGV